MLAKKLLLIVVLGSLLIVSGCKSCKKDESVNTTKGETKMESETKTPQNMYAKFETSEGDIIIELFPDKTPKTVENFVQLARGEKEWTDPKTQQKTQEPLYDNTVFHRVIPNFMIQGGDPLGQGIGGPGYQFEDEFHPELKFDKPGLLAMANSGPNTNGSQFFITHKETPWLNNKHTIFGQVIKGQDVVTTIGNLERNPQTNQPNQEVVLKKVTITSGEMP